MSRPDPFTRPEWQAIARECHLVRQLVGSGATALGKANYADGEGHYYTAFFGLSVGFERLAKLIFTIDFAIENDGGLPSNKAFRSLGHDIQTLFDQVENVAKKRDLDLQYSKPAGAIIDAIIECLNSFANASQGRYANFESLRNPQFRSDFEPISKWWNEVAERILDTHYRGRKQEEKVQKNAAIVADLLDGKAKAIYRNESGNMMLDIQTASIRTGQTDIIQKYGRFYVLSIMRWLCDVFYELSHKAIQEHNIDIVFGHYEILWTYRVDDNYLKTRKNWPAA